MFLNLSIATAIRIFARKPNTFTSFHCRTKCLQNSFLKSVIREWDKLDPDKRNCISYKISREALLNFIRPIENIIYNINDQYT